MKTAGIHSSPDHWAMLSEGLCWLCWAPLQWMEYEDGLDWGRCEGCERSYRLRTENGAIEAVEAIDLGNAWRGVWATFSHPFVIVLEDGTRVDVKDGGPHFIHEEAATLELRWTR